MSDGAAKGSHRSPREKRHALENSCVLNRARVRSEGFILAVARVNYMTAVAGPIVALSR